MAWPCAWQWGLTEESLEIAVTAWKISEFWGKCLFQEQGHGSASQAGCFTGGGWEMCSAGRAEQLLAGDCPHLPQPSLCRILSQPDPSLWNLSASNSRECSKGESSWGNSRSTRRTHLGMTLPFFHHYFVIISTQAMDTLIAVFCIISQKVGLDMCRSIFVVLSWKPKLSASAYPTFSTLSEPFIFISLLT